MGVTVRSNLRVLDWCAVRGGSGGTSGLGDDHRGASLGDDNGVNVGHVCVLGDLSSLLSLTGEDSSGSHRKGEDELGVLHVDCCCVWLFVLTETSKYRPARRWSLGVVVSWFVCLLKNVVLQRAL